MRKKSERSENLQTSIRRPIVCLYQKTKWLKFRIKQSSTRGILNFRAKRIKYFGPLKTKWKFPYICPAVRQTDGILTSSVIWMYVTVKQKHVIETVRKKAIFIKVHNFTYLELSF